MCGLTIILASPQVEAKTKSRLRSSAKVQHKSRMPSHAPSLNSLANMDVNRSLEVRGQTRNLSMMLILKNAKDNIDFVKVRENYQTEISSTEF